jgi:hypothetical protein
MVLMAFGIDCDRPWFQTDEAADGAMELEDESEDEAA